MSEVKIKAAYSITEHQPDGPQPVLGIAFFNPLLLARGALSHCQSSPEFQTTPFKRHPC
jgi:hypothetical protein